MKIRKAEIKDIGGIAKIEENSGYHKKKFNFAEMIKNLFQDKNELIYVAVINKKIVGYRSFNKKGNLADYGYLAITKKFQGKGIGEKLLLYSIVKAKEIGCKRMIISVRNNNFNAIALYNKLKFTIISSKKEGNITKLIMEKRL